LAEKSKRRRTVTTETWVKVSDVNGIIERAKEALDYKHGYTRGKFDELIDEIMQAVADRKVDVTEVTEEEIG
jgi:hypothetical protein